MKEEFTFNVGDKQIKYDVTYKMFFEDHRSQLAEMTMSMWVPTVPTAYMHTNEFKDALKRFTRKKKIQKYNENRKK
jgi:hypothetical protein